VPLWPIRSPAFGSACSAWVGRSPPRRSRLRPSRSRKSRQAKSQRRRNLQNEGAHRKKLMQQKHPKQRAQQHNSRRRRLPAPRLRQGFVRPTKDDPGPEKRARRTTPPGRKARGRVEAASGQLSPCGQCLQREVQAPFPPMCLKKTQSLMRMSVRTHSKRRSRSPFRGTLHNPPQLTCLVGGYHPSVSDKGLPRD
jgi:hypothetical protein